MNIETSNLLSKISFKTYCFRKNYGLITKDEHIITEYYGNISELRIREKLRPLILGEFSFSVWNISLSKTLNIDLDELLKKYSIECTYDELISQIDVNEIDITKYKKIVLIHSLVVKDEYRKLGITEEFVESIYRDYYDENTAIIALVMPFQNNPINKDYYMNQKTIEVLEGEGETPIRLIASQYYTLYDLYKKTDDELNTYKLYSVASRCGFERIGESNLFMLNPEKIIKRLINKNL